MTFEEEDEVIQFAKKQINGRVKMIVGTGSNDTKVAIEHMKANGGAFYESRGSLNGGTLGGALNGKTEQCLLCHGSGKMADIKAVHSKY